MIYTEYQPHPSLAPYIDAYWTVKGNEQKPATEIILPDGCIDIILNAGDDFMAEHNGFSMKNENAYLVGTMTRYKETVMHNGVDLIGIRFKPAAFPVFYSYAPLYEVTNQTIAFDKKLAPDFGQTIKHSTLYLDHFFLNKLEKPDRFIFSIIETIQHHKGQLKVEELAKQHFTTVRQLERTFRQRVGVSPKEFMNLVRYQHTLKRIQNKHSHTSLFDIAFECGYYDHAHLSNEIKKYTGSAPGQI